MPPKSRCNHGPTNTFTLSSPIGDIEVVTCPRAVHSLSVLTDEVNFKPDVNVAVGIKSQKYEDNGYTYKAAVECCDWLQNYFDSRDASLLRKLPPVCHLIRQPSNFREEVWKTLAEKVGFGQTVSYSQLAELCNRSRGSSQAVGQAMRNNPVGIIVPCHRVILSSGSIGNYSGGTRNSVKLWLLKHEGVSV